MEMDLSLAAGDNHGVRLIPALSGTQYGTLGSVLSFTAGDTLTREFSTANSGARMFFFGHSATPMSAEFDAGNLLQLVGCTATIDGTAVADGASIAAYQDGKKHTLICTATGSLSVGYLNQNGAGANFFVGQDFSFSYTISGVTTNIVFDSGSNLYQLARGTTITSIYTDTFDTDYANWTENFGAGDSASVSGGLLTLTRGTNVNLLKKTFTTVTGKSYAVKSNVSTGTQSPQITVTGIYSTGALASGEAGFSFEATGTSTEITLDVAGGAGTASFSDFYLEELPDSACLLNNFATSDWSRYTLQRNITHDAGTVALGWLGDDDVTNGEFSSDVSWTKDVGATISGGKAALTTVAQNAGLYQTSTNTIKPGDYLTKGAVSGYSTGSLKLVVGGAKSSALSADGAVTEIITSSAATQLIEIEAQDITATTANVDDFLARHLIEVV